ncbi:membrane protein [Streptomyces sp. NRRL F-6491]|nr:membrane protein [Streptomyces sp. NRRL F-6491]KOX48328.1 membrane protein [Streptomyces sp. NRRL F-6492]
MLLLPFMVVNLAHWMRPPGRGGSRLVRFYGVLVRLVALTLTVLLTAAACEVALDLTAWQCAAAPACVDSASWLGFLSVERGGWWSAPGRRLAVAALVPTVLVGLLWYLSNRTWSAYEAQRPPTGYDTPPAQPGDTAVEPGSRAALGRPGFWYGRRIVARLRAAHTAAGFLTVAAALVTAAARHDAAAPGSGAVLGRILQAAVAALAVVVLWVVCRRGRSENRLDLRLERALVSWLPGASLALLVLTALYAGRAHPGWTSSGTLPGDAVFSALTVAQGALVVALGAVALLLQRPRRDPRTALRGLGGPAVAMLACALGGIMSGGVAQRVADWLDGPATPGMGDPGPRISPPVLLSWQASVIPVLLLLLAVPAALLVARTVLAARRLRPEVEADYGVTGEGDPVRTERIATVRARTALTDSAPVLVGVVSGATLLLGAASVVGAWASGNVPGRAFDGAHPAVAALASATQALGSWMIGFGFLLFVTWGRRAYRDPSARRTIGILWDVGTFWPRAAHPFAPPCYAERAVPDLTWRMGSWTRRTGGRLVISGHSQGSVLAAAAVWQLKPATRRRVALLTYGSPLERLYGRWFPAYFGPEALRSLNRTVHCWSNLYRATDPIGGPVRVVAEDGRPAVDEPVLLDPVAYGRTRDHPLPEPILGHSDYRADPCFSHCRGGLLDRLPSALPRQREAGEPPERDASGPGDSGQGSSGRSSG